MKEKRCSLTAKKKGMKLSSYRCKGMTKTGKRCKRFISVLGMKDGLCQDHMNKI
jgi:hypothetical protein